MVSTYTHKMSRTKAQIATLQQPTPPAQEGEDESDVEFVLDGEVEKDETEQELERLVFGDSAGFRAGLAQVEEDVEAGADEETGLAGLDDADVGQVSLYIQTKNVRLTHPALFHGHWRLTRTSRTRRLGCRRRSPVKAPASMGRQRRRPHPCLARLSAPPTQTPPYRSRGCRQWQGLHPPSAPAIRATEPTTSMGGARATAVFRQAHAQEASPIHRRRQLRRQLRH